MKRYKTIGMARLNEWDGRKDGLKGSILGFNMFFLRKNNDFFKFIFYLLLYYYANLLRTLSLVVFGVIIVTCEKKKHNFPCFTSIQI